MLKLFLLLFFILTLPASTIATSPRIEVLQRQAERAMKKGDRDRALQLWQQIFVQQNTTSESYAYFQIRQLLQQQNRSNELLPILQQKIQQDPNNPFFLDQLARTQRDLGQLVAAEKTYRQLITHDPTRMDHYLNLGDVLLLQQRPSDAIALYQQAIYLPPQDRQHVHEIVGVGIALYDRKQWALAIQAQQIALRIDPTYAAAAFHLGEIYRDLGDLYKAESFYRQAIAHDSEPIALYHRYGEFLQSQGRITEAIDAYSQALELGKTKGAEFDDYQWLAEKIKTLQRDRPSQP